MNKPSRQAGVAQISLFAFVSVGAIYGGAEEAEPASRVNPSPRPRRESSEIMNCRTNIPVLLQIGFVVLVLTCICSSQTPFNVSNPKQQEWPREEANRIYLSAASDLAREFNRPQSPRAIFTLVLGANENSVDMNARELRLRKWDKYLYAEGVLRLMFDQMLSADSKMRLARRAVAESDATVDLHKTETHARSD